MNLSEGRDRATLDALAAAAGAALLDLHVDADHHRCVLTLAGEEAPRAVALEAIARIDLRRHSGAHPRLGAVDVVPFVALDGRSAAAGAARDRFIVWLAARGVPAYSYGAAEPDLPVIRRLARRGGLRPTAGPVLPHPTAGASTVGARGPLVAYNLWLRGDDIGAARRIASKVRGPNVRALGLRVGGAAQVSMNLVEPMVVGPAEAHDLVTHACLGEGVEIGRAELVGLVPAAVLGGIDPRRWLELDLVDTRTFEARTFESRWP